MKKQKIESKHMQQIGYVYACIMAVFDRKLTAGEALDLIAKKVTE